MIASTIKKNNNNLRDGYSWNDSPHISAWKRLTWKLSDIINNNNSRKYAKQNFTNTFSSFRGVRNMLIFLNTTLELPTLTTWIIVACLQAFHNRSCKTRQTKLRNEQCKPWNATLQGYNNWITNFYDYFQCVLFNHTVTFERLRDVFCCRVIWELWSDNSQSIFGN